jgi:exodeoxyribonuclease V gamma subunit
LHAFSPRYFSGKDKRLFSYSEANAAASRSLRSNSNQPLPDFFAEALPEPGEEARRVELKSLIEFFDNPAKYFIRRRLRLSLKEEDDALENSEPFELNALDCYSLQQELVVHRLEHQRVTADQFAARGLLPLGEMGTAHFQTLLGVAQEFGKRVEPELRGQAPDQPLLVDLPIGLFSLTGQIDSIYGGRIIRFRCATLKPRDRLRAWINHLVFCAANSGAARETLLIGTDDSMKFSPPEGALATIADLLDIYWRGLSRALPFFPESALNYANAQFSPSKNARSSSLDKARQVWRGSRWNGGLAEKNDLYYAFCFPDRDPLNGEFMELALEIFEPMLRNSAVNP